VVDEGKKRMVRRSPVLFTQIRSDLTDAHLSNLYRLRDRYFSVNWDVEELLAKQDAIIKGDLLKVRMRIS
jgi:hypothetical protein